MPRRGGLPRRCRRGGRQRYPAGGVPALSPAYTAFSFVFLPPSPDPLPGGKGVTIGYFMQGAAPLASPGAEPARHWFALPLWKTQWGLPRRCRRGGCQRCPAGGVPALSPVNPAFRFLFCPLSPRPPSPVGKGEIFCFLMQGASPLASPGLNPGGTGYPRPGGEDHLKRRRRLRRIVPSPPVPLSLAAGTARGNAFPLFLHRATSTLSQGTCMAETVSAASGLMPGCRGRQPPAK